MSRILLITGGCRSGKSGFAVEMARQLKGPTTFLATCVACDEEMRERVAAHREQRPAAWDLVEEPLDLEAALASIADGTVLLDCVPAWIGNQMMRGDACASMEAAIERLGSALAACRAGVALVVSAEVGDGLVPEYELGRVFRDCVGRANQVLARRAEKVFLLTAGLARELKQQAVSPADAARSVDELADECDRESLRSHRGA